MEDRQATLAGISAIIMAVSVCVAVIAGSVAVGLALDPWAGWAVVAIASLVVALDSYLIIRRCRDDGSSRV